MARCHLHKFGGSSLADADCYRRVAHILLTHGHSDDLVVVSAAGKSTNFLYKLLELSTTKQLWQEELQTLISFQQNLIEQLLSNEQARSLRERLSNDKAQLISLLSIESINDYQSNQVVSFGERWSARLLAALLRESGVAASDVDARTLLIADEGAVPQIRLQESRQRVHSMTETHPNERLIITGFICANERGDTLLLGRNGSDFSATLIASLADIERVTIWTDVEGVFNADPNKINDAKLLSSLSLAEANRLAHLGSPVLHNRTLQPLFDTQVSLAVRSSYASHTDFTLIAPKSSSASAPVVTNLSSVALFNLELKTELKQLIELLDEAGLSPLAYWELGQDRVELTVTLENQKQVLALLDINRDALGVSDIKITEDLGLVALVSADANLYRRGFARLLSRNARPLFNDGMSLVTLVPQGQVNLLTQKVHRRCAGPRKRIGVLLLGVGNIGEAWVDLFSGAKSALNKELEASVELVGLLSSKKALINDDGIELETWKSTFEKDATPWEYDSLFEDLHQLECDEVIALDISASAILLCNTQSFLPVAFMLSALINWPVLVHCLST